MQNTLRSVSHARRMIPDLRTATQRLYPDYTHRIIQKRRKHPRRITAATTASSDYIRQKSGHLHKLLTSLYSDHHLEVTHHQRERMRTNY